MLTVKNQNDDTDIVLMFLLLILSIFHTFSSVSIVDFKQVNVRWVISFHAKGSFCPFLFHLGYIRKPDVF